MEHGDPLLWYTLDQHRKALALGWLSAAAKDRLDAQKKQKKQKKAGHETPQWMQAGSTNFMPDLD